MRRRSFGTRSRRWALNEVGAAMAHQIIDPLTALLIYLHEMKRVSDTSSAGEANPAGAIVNDALREAERVCAIMERIANSFEGPRSSHLAIARGREAILWLKRSSEDHVALASDRSQLFCLTKREYEVFNLISSGISNKIGAMQMNISTRTFEGHRAKIMRKLGAANLTDLIRMSLLA
jgi:DNA-binding NarL/FixJ family response regulator